eukprot:m.91910 g.91910  ORF g.91910 m.91910 type:complete len:265 (+) comp11998_c0_seq1:235-1029(+)
MNTTSRLGTSRASSRNTHLTVFNVEYRGCIPMNEQFPQPGAMLPEHFTKLAEGIEAQIASKNKRTIKKESKTYRKAHLNFDTSNAIITVIDAADANILGVMPLLELLSFRVLRGQSTSYTEALLFAKHPSSSALAAHRIVFESTPDITSFHSTLKREFNAVASTAERLVRVVPGSTTSGPNGARASGGDTGETEETSAMSVASSSSGSGSSGSSGGRSRRSYFFSNLDSEDGELIISDRRSPSEPRMVKNLASEGDSDIVEAEC